MKALDELYQITLSKTQKNVIFQKCGAPFVYTKIKDFCSVEKKLQKLQKIKEIIKREIDKIKKVKKPSVLSSMKSSKNT